MMQTWWAQAWRGQEPSWLGELESLGPVALVGGAVRDSLLGAVPRDYDVCVATSREAMAAWCATKTCVPTTFAAKRLTENGITYDVWALEETRGIQTCTFEGMLETSTLSSDSGYVTRKVTSIEAIKRTIANSILDAQHPEHVNDKQAAKAYALSLRYAWDLSDPLRAAILALPFSDVARQALARYDLTLSHARYERWLALV